MIGYVEYDFELLEINGENVVEHFKNKIDVIAKERNLHYEIIVENDSKMKGGNSTANSSNSTFPYNVFESTADNFFSQKTDLDVKRKGLFELLFGEKKDVPETEYNNTVLSLSTAENAYFKNDINAMQKNIIDDNDTSEGITENKDLELNLNVKKNLLDAATGLLSNVPASYMLDNEPVKIINNDSEALDGKNIDFTKEEALNDDFEGKDELEDEVVDEIESLTKNKSKLIKIKVKIQKPDERIKKLS